MSPAEVDLIKHREIVFADGQPEELQGSSAARLLAEVEGVLETQALSPTQIAISYHLLQVSLEQIENALTEAGFNLSIRPLERIRRALYYYAEDTQRANNGCVRGECKCTRKIFINRYERLEHGCRDSRPEHWRKYL